MASASDKLLFTPGPITTSMRVKRAMLVDLGSRDSTLIDMVAEVRGELLRIAGLDPEVWAVVPMQGSGTFGLEAVAASATPADGHWLVVVNGAYGRRMADIVERLGIRVAVVACDEARPADPAAVADALHQHPEATHVAVAHCETSSGLINDIGAIGTLAAAAGKVIVVDAISSFGGLSIDFEAARIDWLVASPNKCLQSVPGFSFVFARRDQLVATSSMPTRSLALDLGDQWRRLEADGQFRFTPPTHALLALREALVELDDEGGVAARGERYGSNHKVLMEGMARLGFEAFLAAEHQSPIITTFLAPSAERFDMAALHRRLGEAGMAIYPGKQTHAETFRVGTIGAIDAGDVARLVEEIERIVGDWSAAC